MSDEAVEPAARSSRSPRCSPTGCASTETTPFVLTPDGREQDVLRPPRRGQPVGRCPCPTGSGRGRRRRRLLVELAVVDRGHPRDVVARSIDRGVRWTHPTVRGATPMRPRRRHDSSSPPAASPLPSAPNRLPWTTKASVGSPPATGYLGAVAGTRRSGRGVLHVRHDGRVQARRVHAPPILRGAAHDRGCLREHGRFSAADCSGREGARDQLQPVRSRRRHGTDDLPDVRRTIPPPGAEVRRRRPCRSRTLATRSTRFS